jgi:hypothetical protein
MLVRGAAAERSDRRPWFAKSAQWDGPTEAANKFAGTGNAWVYPSRVKAIESTKNTD